MKTNNNSLRRLRKLAIHLGSRYVNDVIFKNINKSYSCSKAACNIEHFNWALAELPNLDSKN